MSHLSVFRNFWETLIDIKLWHLMVSKQTNLLFLWVWENRIHYLCSMETGTSKPKGSIFQLESRFVGFSNGTVCPRVGDCLFPLNTNDGFIFSHTLLLAMHCFFLTSLKQRKFTIKVHIASQKYWLKSIWDFQQSGICDQQRLRPACAYAQSDQSLC